MSRLDDTSVLEAAQALLQQNQYDLCLLTLHAITYTDNPASTTSSQAQALAAICKIHKHAAVQEWHKVKC